MTTGQHVMTTQPIVGSKKNVYASNMELLTIISVHHWPVLLVTKYGCNDRFPVHSDNITTELHPKYLRHIQKDEKNKTVTKWQ
jgi:hypothetical protein